MPTAATKGRRPGVAPCTGWGSCGVGAWSAGLICLAIWCAPRASLARQDELARSCRESVGHATFIAKSLKKIEGGAKPEEVFETLVCIATHPDLEGVLAQPVVRAIFHLSSDDGDVRDRLLTVIKSVETTNQVRREVCRHLVFVADEETRLELLKRLDSEWPKMESRYALDAFTELGDKKALAWIAKKITELGGDDPRVPWLHHVEKKILVQDKVVDLLDHLAPDRDDLKADWVVRQAVRHGASRRDVRDKLLARLRSPGAKEQPIRHYRFVRACEEIGVLQQEDQQDLEVVRAARAISLSGDPPWPRWATRADVKRAEFYHMKKPGQEAFDTRAEDAPAKGLKRVQQLRDSLREGDLLTKGTAGELLHLVSRSDEHTLTRKAALTLLCEKAPKTSSGEVLQAIGKLATKLGAETQGQPTTEYYAIPVLLSEFLVSGAQSLGIRLDDPTELLDVYMSILEEPRIHDEGIQDACYERIADNPASLSTRQEYLLRVIRARPNYPAPESFVGLVDESIVDDLRRVAFEGPLCPKGYNMGAMDLLAEHGDKDTAVRFRAWASKRGHGDEAVNAVGGFVWRIESQHNPHMLLDHLRSNEWIGHQTRPWALRKAISLRVDPERIRSALIEHAKGVESDERLRIDLARLKTMAVKRGILREGDMPEVKLGDERPVP